MDIAEAAELQQLLEGVALPAQKRELLGYATAQGARPEQVRALRGLPGRLYDTIDEVAEELVPVQPSADREVPHAPREESGAPPGGEAYVGLYPESGAVRA